MIIQKLNDYKYIHQKRLFSTQASIAKQKDEEGIWMWIWSESINLSAKVSASTKKNIHDNHEEYSKWAVNYI